MMPRALVALDGDSQFPTGFEGIVEALPVLCGTFLFFMCWYPLSMAISPRFELYQQLDSEQKKAEWHGRGAAILMAVIAVGMAVPAYFDPSQEMIDDPNFGQSSLGRLTCSFVAGYFLWDIGFCLYNFDITLLAHGVLCFFVYLLNLTGWIQYIAMFFLFFEISTPLQHIRAQMIASKATDSTLYQVVQLLFCAAFLIIRIGLGVPMSILWWNDMIDLQESGRGARGGDAVMAFCLTANIVLNALNCLWAYKIVTGLIKLAQGKYTPTEAEHNIVKDSDKQQQEQVDEEAGMTPGGEVDEVADGGEIPTDETPLLAAARKVRRRPDDMLTHWIGLSKSCQCPVKDRHDNVTVIATA